ncbi:transcription/translation regulatory transformer protein RfaH [Aliidiomarina soli]|uniref:Transcription antitermination protein RfaH n=1 Tax=Aliidiomarina soli TaxID=1928574 RepID=A0A432WD56_9GAMM|nr:transcription/translation regulatory transformer protein RfaH [Aliidiomarina soli]RUO30323.1 transcription/translation regulatory transformer protein RfaH [Aliidiomarina soli]
MTDWYLLHCKARQEARAKMHIENQGYTTCLPTIRLQKTLRGKRQVVEEALFPSYLFIQIDMENANFNSIRSTRGVNGFVRFGGIPSKIPQSVIEQFQALEGQQTDPQAQFEAGAEVEIAEGPFAGLPAVYKISKGDDRCLVLLEMMGKQQQLELKEAALKKR